ncbi:MAG TPA: hypothetical protein VJZ73_13290 [Methylomirabilota bacterium]|nr:hypothetical protein [Methylomirabilota bacterium]
MIALPSNSAIDTLLRATDRDPAAVALARKLDRAFEQAELEDYRTISSDRGPVRGYGGGARRR